MNKKTLIITSKHIQDTIYCLTMVGDESVLKRKIEKVIRTGRPEYVETEQKTVLVMTKALLDNSSVEFVGD